MNGLDGTIWLLDVAAIAKWSWQAPLLAAGTGWSGSFSQMLGMVLWIGLAILTVSLLVLMRTRWGQAQPLSKCVVLSVFAHLLFIAYAYGTRLIFDAPPAPRPEQVMRLAFVEQNSHTVDKPRQKQAWDEFPTEFTITPDLTSPRQQEVQVEAELPDRAVVQPEFAFQLREAPVPDPGVESPSVIPPVPAAEVLSPAEPTEIEIVRAEPTTEPSTLPELPGPPPLERLAAEPLTQPPADATVMTEVPNLLPDASTMQRLSDVDFSQDLGDASASSIDLTAAADNRAANSRPEGPGGATGGAAAGGDLPDGPEFVGANPALPPASRRLGDGEALPDVYQLRMARNRMALIVQQGGSEQTEQSVEAALKWLAAHQEPDGRWDVVRYGGGRETKVLGHDREGAGIRADTGITGLALLAFLSAGHTHFEGEYRKTVQRGLEFVLGQQAGDGNLAGGATMFARMYCHGMATLAISEAYAMTGDHRMRGYVERAVQYTIDAQDSVHGGWRYQPADRGDMSQFGWQVMALKSAELAGIKIPGETRAGMIRFLRSVSKGEQLGLASYRPTERASETMTAEALACRFFLGIYQDEQALHEATSYLRQQLPGSGQANFYYWYYGTLGLFQAQAIPNSLNQPVHQEVWAQWNAALQQQLLARQERHGEDAGSFSPDTVWGAYGGRVYTTAMATLCLEVYYRYLPVYERGAAAAAANRNVPRYRVLR